MASSSLVSTGGSHGSNGWSAYDVGIMIVDEDPTSLLLVTTMLKACHYRVVSFDNPAEALYELCQRVGEFDLVISDLHMVTMPGFNLVERVAKGVGLPIITTCADDNSQLLHQALDCGACFHLVKPININNMEFVWKKSWHNRAKGPFGPPRPLKFVNDNIMVPSYEGDGISAGKRLHHIGSTSSCKKLTRDESSSTRKKDEHREKDEDYDSDELARVRLQWDRELHERFKVAAALLGDDAVPTSIIGIMNVAGLTTKQVASHLQKYRKRLQKEKELKEKEEERAKSKKTVAPNTPTTLAPTCSKRPVLNNQNYQPQVGGTASMLQYQKSGTRRTPFILPKPPTTIQAINIQNCAMRNTSSGHFSTIGMEAYHHNSGFGKTSPMLPTPMTTYPMSIENIAIANASNERAKLLENWRSQVELNASRRLLSYQQNSSSQMAPLVLPQPSVTDQFTFTTDAGVSSLENNSDVSEIYNTLYPSNVDTSPLTDPFSYILDTSADTSAWQRNDGVETLDTAMLGSETMNNKVQEPAVYSDSEWRALEDFLGLNESPAAPKDQVDVGVGSSTNFNFDFNFDLDYDFSNFNDLTFDDDFLAEMLDDFDKDGAP